MAGSAPIRASGRVAADEAAAVEAGEIEQPVVEDDTGAHKGLQINLNGGPVTRPEDARMSLTPSFSRMRTDWNAPDREVIQQMHKGAELLIQKNFGEVFDIMYEIYSLVREPVVDPQTSEVVCDAFGLPEWRKEPGTNSFVEDWTKVGYREREMLLFKITTGVFRWTQRRDEIWAEALFARAGFEEAFAHGYQDLKGDKATIDDRTARARALAAEHRYHAVYASYLSRRADSVVRSAELLGQRLKDVSGT